MLFCSFEYAIFLPTVFLLYWNARKRQRQNLVIAVASYVFYGWWDWRFLSLIALTSTSSYFAGRLMSQSSRLQHRRLICRASVAINLLVLATFKYYDFFVSSLTGLLSIVGIHPDWVTLHLVVPVGISFYTFQAIGYTIDVYRRQIAAERDIVSFIAYISFFPQLVAGPIEQAKHLLPQFGKNLRFDAATATDGLRQILWGLFKKMVVADNCAPVVDNVWSDLPLADGASLTAAMLLFAVQIYGDFSGYSDIAAGSARLFGFELTDNFHYPYFATGLRDFWRRWHISLMRWLVDYVYIPLGGSRISSTTTIRNILVVFGVSGLWHGANWTFVAWGLYHGLLLVAERQLAKRYLHTSSAIGRTAVFVTVIAGWVLFRAPSLSAAADFFTLLIVQPWGRVPTDLLVPLTAAIFMFAAEWHSRRYRHALQVDSHTILGHRRILRRTIYIALLVALSLFSGTQSQFIYFQF